MRYISSFILIFLIGILCSSSICFGNKTEIPGTIELNKPVSHEQLNFAGDNQTQKVNSWLENTIKVDVIYPDKNLMADAEIEFLVIDYPYGAKNYCIKNTSVIVKSSGIISNKFKLGDKPGIYKVLVKSKASDNYLIYTFHARKSNWLFILIIGLIGGLGLFLYGMHLMSEGLQNSAGDNMRAILSRLTFNRYIAFFVGIFVTTIVQSSSATSVMLVGFVNSRLMKFRQTIGIILGATIGSTITAQIIAFKLTDYALLFVSAGFILFVFFSRQKIKEIGRSILGFGILFFGIYIMSDAMYPLRDYQPFLNILIKLESPVAGILIGIVFTAIIQSSAAFIGILIILSMQGFLSPQSAIPLIIGSNVGTSITAILASIGASTEAKQVALAHTLIKIFGALVFICFLSFFIDFIIKLNPVSSTDTITPRQIANAHTLYNVILCILFLPVTRWFEKLVKIILPVKYIPYKELKTKYLDPALLKSPSLAVNGAREELLRMMQKVIKMTKIIITPFLDRQHSDWKHVDNLENEINYLRDEITKYVLIISRSNIKSSIVKETFQILYAVEEFEQIADIIATKFKEKAISWCSTKTEFSDEGKKNIMENHQMTLKQLYMARDVYKKLSVKKAQKLRDKHEKNKIQYFELQKLHYNRLQKEIKETVESRKIHKEVMILLQSISSHATNTARILLFD